MLLKVKQKKVPIQPAGTIRARASRRALMPGAVAKNSGAQQHPSAANQPMQVGITTKTKIAQATKPAAGAEAGRASQVAIDGVPTHTTLAVPVVMFEIPVAAPHTYAAGAKTAAGVTKSRRTRREAIRRHIDLDQPGFLRLEDVLTLIPVSRAAWYAGVKAGTWPPSVALGARSVGWPTASIKALIDRLSTGSGE